MNKYKSDEQSGDQRTAARASSPASSLKSTGEQLSGMASTITSDVQEALDHQLGRGAKVMSNVAQSARIAAQELQTDSPQIATLVRSVADRVEAYSRDLEGKSVTELYQEATDFTRRNPALIFGIAALTGFFALRTVKSSGARANVSHAGGRSFRGEFHGS